METRSSKAKALKRKLQLEKRMQENEKLRKLDNSSQSPSENPLTSIDILNDDALLMIFRYLTIKDLITIERVSKKWKELSLMSWVNFKKIKLAEDICDRFSISNVKYILRKGAEYITHLSFEHLWGEITSPDRIITSINLCTNLTHLTFPLNFFGNIRLSSISDNVAKNLKSLQVKDFFKKSRESDLLHILQKTTNLEELTLSRMRSDGTCLINLTENCKKLSLPECRKIKNTDMKMLLERLHNIEDLNISGTKILPETLAAVSNQLRVLKLSCMQQVFSDNSCKDLSFSNLRVLDLSRNRGVFNDDALCALIAACPMLVDLDLYGNTLNGNSFCQLAKLKDLTRLNVGATNITDDYIVYLASRLENLEEVACLRVREATTSGLLEFIKICSNLKCLTIGESSQFTSKFFELSEKFARERSSILPLKVQVFFFHRPALSIWRPEFREKLQAELDRLQLKPVQPGSNQKNRCRIVEYLDSSLWSYEEAHEIKPVWCAKLTDD